MSGVWLGLNVRAGIKSKHFEIKLDYELRIC